MPRLKATMRQSGYECVTIRVEHHLGLSQLAHAVWNAAPNEASMFDWLRTAPARELLQHVKEVLERRPDWLPDIEPARPVLGATDDEWAVALGAARRIAEFHDDQASNREGNDA